MIVMAGEGVGYAGGPPVLRDVAFTVPEGDLVLVVGRTGAGKSSLLRAVADLVPGAELVPQDPWSALRAAGGGTVEQLVRAGAGRRAGDGSSSGRRVEEVLDLFDLAGLRSRSVDRLSGGQQQRLAIAVALAVGPSVLVLDEPTSALDPVAAEEVLATLHRLAHDVGTTLLVAEHRLERVVHHADAVLLVDGGTVAGPLPPAEAMRIAPVRPPLVELGVALGWDPLPLSVRDARRSWTAVRAALADGKAAGLTDAPPGPTTAQDSAAAPLLRVRGLGVVRDDDVALRGVELSVGPGEVVALMGRNGSGKSTLFDTVAGGLSPSRGRVDAAAAVVHAPQQAGRVLTEVTVAEQLATCTDPVAARSFLDDLAPGVQGDTRVDGLSQGRQLALAVATVLGALGPIRPPGTAATAPRIVLLDEPTRGLDYEAKARLAAQLRSLASAGNAVVVATHDVELAARLATRVVVLAEGEVISDGPVRDVLTASPAFAPQVAKVVHPAPYLTTVEVLDALAGP